MIKYILYAVLSSIMILQTGCLRNNVRNGHESSVSTAEKIESADCQDDPLDFYNAMPVLADAEPTENYNQIPFDEHAVDCVKLRKAIKLSLPGGKNQNDQLALSLLNELIQNSSLTGRDLKFTMLLLQHVSQRQQLRKMIALQEKHQIKIRQENMALKSRLETLQSQLDQLKNIEIEIDKKERSVFSPISE